MVPENYKSPEPEWKGNERRRIMAPEITTHIDPKELGMLIQSVQSLEKMMNYKFDELSKTITESNVKHSSTADGLKMLITENFNHFDGKISDHNERISKIEQIHIAEEAQRKERENGWFKKIKAKVIDMTVGAVVLVIIAVVGYLFIEWVKTQ
jgi:hypothetical protein